jgi:hypothetical protein
MERGGIMKKFSEQAGYMQRLTTVPEPDRWAALEQVV